MKEIENKLIVFTRYPEAGKTKTRLIESLGPDGAADLQREMTEAVLVNARSLQERGECEIEVWFAGGTEQLMREWLGVDLLYVKQEGRDLGERMASAFKASIDAGAKRTIITGVDCPGMTADVVKSGFRALDDCDLVLGPAFDGGYYLIGLKENQPDLFRNIEWGTKTVLKDTMRIARGQKLAVTQLEKLTDVDYPSDLNAWTAARGNVTVIIPAVNEELSIEAAIKSAQSDSSAEIIVADGGSGDKTVSIARELGARIVSAPRGRGVQMNAGVLAASGDILVFLHADTILPPDYIKEVRKALGCPKVAAGAFTLSIEGKDKALQLVEKGVDIRSRYFRAPYGDQALFMTKSIFNRAGGYSDMPIMEDLALVKQLRRMGKIRISDKTVITSGRRWEAMGVLKTTVTNQLMLAGYQVGVPIEHLASYYRKKKTQ